MTDLVIEYVLESRRPGYNYTSATNGFSDETLKEIWRQAMPRGQGWRHYTGARSLKGFPIEGGRRAAISNIVVTDQEDETGRKGIRRAEIIVLDAGQFLEYLTLRLVMLPDAIRDQAEKKLSWFRWRKIVERSSPKMRKNKGQILLTAPYTTSDTWQVIEAVVLTVATSMPARAMKGWPAVFSMTTLALDNREEARIVALPQSKVEQLASKKQLNGASPIALGR